MRNLFPLLLLLILTACGTAHTVVLDPVRTPEKFTHVALVAENPNVEVPADVIDKLETVIRKGLFEKGPFAPGDELRLHYTFISHDAGNQFARWFWAGIGNAGEGSVTVSVRYLDRDNREIAKTQVEGRIGSGFFGGSISEAISRAGDDIVEFTINQFAARR